MIGLTLSFEAQSPRRWSSIWRSKVHRATGFRPCTWEAGSDLSSHKISSLCQPKKFKNACLNGHWGFYFGANSRTCCCGRQGRPHHRTPGGHRRWGHSGLSHCPACRLWGLRSCQAVSCQPPQSCRGKPWSRAQARTHLLQKVSLLGMLVGGIRLFPSDQNLEILEILRKEYPENIGDIAQTIRWCLSAEAERHRIPCSWSCTFCQKSRWSWCCLHKKCDYILIFLDPGIFTHPCASLGQSDDTLLETQSWPSPCNAPWECQR